jgi:hypothetical protein
MKKICEVLSQPEKVWDDLTDKSLIFRTKILAFILGCHIAGRGTTVHEIGRFIEDCTPCVLKACHVFALMGLIDMNESDEIVVRDDA